MSFNKYSRSSLLSKTQTNRLSIKYDTLDRTPCNVLIIHGQQNSMGFRYMTVCGLKNKVGSMRYKLSKQATYKLVSGWFHASHKV